MRAEVVQNRAAPFCTSSKRERRGSLSHRAFARLAEPYGAMPCRAKHRLARQTAPYPAAPSHAMPCLPFHAISQ